MIKSFRHKGLRKFFETGTTAGIQPSHAKRLRMQLARTVTPEMALRLARAIGRSPESWLAMQDAYDLWHAKKTTNLSEVVAFDWAIA